MPEFPQGPHDVISALHTYVDSEVQKPATFDLLQQVPPHVRMRMTELRTDATIARKDSSTDIATIRGNLLTNERQQLDALLAIETPTIEDRSEIARLQNVLMTTSPTLDHLDATSSQTQSREEELREFLFQQAVENYYDKKTGLFLVKAADHIGAQFIQEWLVAQEKDAIPLQNISLVMEDRMLFHNGNENLTPKGFDERIRVAMGGHIAASRYLAQDETDTYMPYKDGEEDKLLSLYFPPGSAARQKLDEMKASGITYAPFRLNAGGDEFFYQIINRNKNASQQELDYGNALALDVISYVTQSTTITPRRETIMEPLILSEKERQERSRIYTAFCNAANLGTLQIRPDRNMPKREVAYLHAFMNTLRHYFRNNEPLKRHLMDTSLDLCMDFAMMQKQNGELPTYDDAVIGFFYGTDTQGNKTGESFFTETGEINMDRLAFFGEKLVESARLSATSQELQDPHKRQAIIEKLLMQQIASEYHDYLNTQVNDFSKREKKAQVFESAYKGNLQSIMTVGAVSIYRSFLKEDDKALHTYIAKNLIKHYETLFNDEELMEEGEQLRQFRDEWETRKQQVLRGEYKGEEQISVD